MGAPVEVGGPVEVKTNDPEPLVHTLLPHFQPIINDCARNMKPFLTRLGVDDDELSPFCRNFDSVSDLLCTYNDMFSHGRKKSV